MARAGACAGAEIMDKGGVEKEPEIIKFVSATLDPKGEKFKKTTYTNKFLTKFFKMTLKHH